MKNQSIEKVDRAATAEELFRTSNDEAAGISRPAQRVASGTPEPSMDYQWYEVTAEELVSLMAVCSSGSQN